MRLSEAIRIGASWSKKCVQMLKDEDGRTCALGSAWEGIWGEMPYPYPEGRNFPNELGKKFRYLYHVVNAPYLPHNVSLMEVIWRMNDEQNFTREEIADFVEKLEIENGWTGTPEIAEHEIAYDTAAV